MSRVLGDDWLLPALDEGNREFFTRGRVVLQACATCGQVQHPPDEVCGGCRGITFEPRESAGIGRIESVAVVHHPVHPVLADVVPYAVVLVSLDDVPGVHLVGNVRGTEASEIAIGQRVRAVFIEVPRPDDEPLRIPEWEIVAAD